MGLSETVHILIHWRFSLSVISFTVLIYLAVRSRGIFVIDLIQNNNFLIKIATSSLYLDGHHHDAVVCRVNIAISCHSCYRRSVNNYLSRNYFVFCIYFGYLSRSLGKRINEHLSCRQSLSPVSEHKLNTSVQRGM